MSRICHGCAAKSGRKVSWRKNPTMVASPKSMEAVTATWPTRLNQPVNQEATAARRGGAIFAAQ